MAETDSTAKVFTLEDVSKHNSEKDCWIIIEGKVLDVTPFLSQHPGGDDIILDGAGKDLTSEFEDTGHSTDARKQMEKYVIGRLDGVSAAASKAKTAAPSPGSVNPAVLVAVLLAIIAALFLLLSPDQNPSGGASN